jgi:hypothetical protein
MNQKALLLNNLGSVITYRPRHILAHGASHTCNFNYGMCASKSFTTLHRLIIKKLLWLTAVKFISACLGHSNILVTEHINIPRVLFNLCANEIMRRSCVA